MNIDVPPRLTKRTRDAVWLNRLRDAVARISPLIGPNRRLMQTTGGTFDLPEARGGGGAAPSPGMVFKGEYTAQAYSAGNVVVIRGTLSRGTYIAARSVPSNIAPADPPVDPGQGIYWIKISNGDSIGQWS